MIKSKQRDILIIIFSIIIAALLYVFLPMSEGRYGIRVNCIDKTIIGISKTLPPGAQMCCPICSIDMEVIANGTIICKKSITTVSLTGYETIGCKGIEDYNSISVYARFYDENHNFTGENNKTLSVNLGS